MFYDNLKQACKKNGTSVTAILKKIGMGTANGTFWKNGSSPSGDVIVQLSELLNVSTDYLLMGKEKSLSPELSEDKQRLIYMYDLLNDMEKGEILGELKEKTKEQIEAKNAETA